MSFCTKCGCAVEVGSSFCSACGAPARKGATSSEPAQSTLSQEQRSVCAWCSKEMVSGALKCAHCGKWRKDISTDRVAFYSFFGASALPLNIAVYQAVSPWDGSFSFSAVVGSIWFLLFVLANLPLWYYYAKLSKKMGTWWWF